MWSRKELKTQAVKVMHTCYWYSVLVCFIVAILNGGFRAGFSFKGDPMAGIGAIESIFTGDEDAEDLVDDVEDDIENDIEPYEHEDAGVEDVLKILPFLAVSLFVFAGIFFVILIFSLLFTFCLARPVLVGANRFFMVSRQEKATLGELGYAFKNDHFKSVVKTEFLRSLFTGLWTLLLVVPGIIKSYEYRMIPYILSECPSIDYKEAFRLSKEMMDGEKMNTFVLDLSFLGWHLLSLCCTCGILSIFYVSPYVRHTNAELYAVLREKALTSGITSTYVLSGYGEEV